MGTGVSACAWEYKRQAGGQVAALRLQEGDEDLALALPADALAVEAHAAEQPSERRQHRQTRGLRTVQMRESIRANRMKDVRHKCVQNASVIEEIGQMWWNPRNGFNRCGCCCVCKRWSSVVELQCYSICGLYCQASLLFNAIDWCHR